MRRRNLKIFFLKTSQNQLKIFVLRGGIEGLTKCRALPNSCCMFNKTSDFLNNLNRVFSMSTLYRVLWLVSEDKSKLIMSFGIINYTKISF